MTGAPCRMENMNADGSNDELTDIGHNVRIRIRRYPVNCVDAGKIAGMYYEHPCTGGVVSPDFISFKPEWKDGWDVLKLEPLTLSPSLLCRVCGHHGFVQNGRWVPC